MFEGNKKRGRGFHLIYLLLIMPFTALLWVPFYNRTLPELDGIPFFYWYQMMWILVGAVLIIPVYLVENRRNGRGK